MGSVISKVKAHNETNALLAECAARLPAPILKIIAQRYAEAYYSDFYYVRRMVPFDILEETDPLGYKTIRKAYQNVIQKNHFIISLTYFRTNGTRITYYEMKSETSSEIKCVIDILERSINRFYIFVYKPMDDTYLQRLIKISMLLIYKEDSPLDIKTLRKYKVSIIYKWKSYISATTTTIVKFLKA